MGANDAIACVSRAIDVLGAARAGSAAMPATDHSSPTCPIAAAPVS